MHGYADAKGTFPPPAVYGADGDALLSWRVLLLPYLERRELFEQFKLDESWDGPHHQSLLEKMSPVYAPYDGRPTAEAWTTHYQVFVGRGAAFEPGRGLRLKDDFPDGTSNTLLAVQAARAVPWTKPADLDFAPGAPLPPLGGIFPGTLQVVLADGSVRSLPDTVPESTLRALVTRNGGERIDPADLDAPQ
jgi:hypothetical protein